MNRLVLLQQHGSSGTKRRLERERKLIIRMSLLIREYDFKHESQNSLLFQTCFWYLLFSLLLCELDALCSCLVLRSVCGQRFTPLGHLTIVPRQVDTLHHARRHLSLQS